MGNFADSPTWKWRLIIRFFGVILLILPFAVAHSFGLSFSALSLLAGFLLVMVS